MRIEQAFLTAFRKKWLSNNVGGLWFKIPDAPVKNQVAKPFDAFSVFNGTSIAWEAKQTTKKTFNLKDLHQSQLDGLSRATKNGWIAFVIIYYPLLKQYMAVPYSYLEMHGKVDQGDFELEDIKI